MANDLTGNPLKVDTAGVIETEAIDVVQMVWQEPSAAGEDLVVKDAAGRILWDENSYMGGVGVSIEQDFFSKVPGITVETIDSGTLYIYYKR